MHSIVTKTRKEMDKMLIFFKMENRPYYIMVSRVALRNRHVTIKLEITVLRHFIETIS